MEYSALGFLGAYIGVISFMTTILVMLIAIVAIAFLEGHRKNLNVIVLWLFRFLCWLSMIMAACYALLSTYNVVYQLILNLVKKP
ncbi:MAG: hypothetical protein PHV55_02780 [Candidatus Omnitrophica bacterium]|nr:hypothetical protein [Candidatus Omnitrophota bacterium]